MLTKAEEGLWITAHSAAFIPVLYIIQFVGKLLDVLFKSSAKIGEAISL